MRKGFLYLLLILPAIGPGNNAAHRYEAVPLGRFEGQPTWATALNQSNQVVGSTIVGEPNRQRAFLWENGTMRLLGTIDEADTHASAINNRGVAVGWLKSEQGHHRAVKFADGEAIDLSAGLPTYSYAHDINDAGQIVGSAYPTSNDAWLRPFLLAPNRRDLLGPLNLVNMHGGGIEAYRINEAGQILLGSQTARLLTPPQNFVQASDAWSGGRGYALNETGEFAGQGALTFFARTAVLWRDGKLHELPMPRGMMSGFSGGSLATAMNNRDQIAGHIDYPVAIGRDFWNDGILWENGMAYALRDLVLNREEIEEARLEVAGMNDSGALVVNARWNGKPPGGETGAVEPVPPVQPYLLRPLAEVTLPQITLTSPDDLAIVPHDQPLSVSWESSGEIESIELTAFSVRTVKLTQFGEDPPVIGGGSVRLELAGSARSAVLTGLPLGPVAIRIQGRTGERVRFVAQTRVFRVVGPARVVPVRITENGSFLVRVEGTPEALYHLEWSTNLIQWQVTHDAFNNLFGLPFAAHSAMYVRSVKDADEGGPR